jgi:uncharacterized protein with GYD domain
MAVYMTQWAYTAEAWANLAKKPEDRSAVTKALIEKAGGRLIAWYNCFGEYDGLAIYENADETAAMAGVLAAIAPGHLKATKTTVLITAEEGVEAMRKAGAISYSAPKG